MYNLSLNTNSKTEENFIFTSGGFQGLSHSRFPERAVHQTIGKINSAIIYKEIRVVC